MSEKRKGPELTEDEEAILAYIQAEPGVRIEQIIRDLEIPGRLLPELTQSLVQKGLVEVRDNRYFGVED